MRRIVFSIVLGAALGLASGFAPASAQTDTRALWDRIDRLERDLSGVQSQMSRGGGGRPGATVITSPALGGGSSLGNGNGGDSGPGLPPGMAARLDERVDQLEEQLRHLTGKVEEANYKAAQVAKQLERMQADFDLRLKDLQSGSGQSAAAPQMSMNAAGATAPLKGSNSAEGTGPAPGPQPLGTIPEKDLKKLMAQPGQPAAQPAPKDAQGLYDDAYAAAQRGDYPGAEKGFQAFLHQYPSHQLAGNAHYWLGYIAYARKDFTGAAILFADSYKKFPKHGKSPDMLYKLGSSFGQLGKTKEACKALSLLFSEHPDMPDRVKRAATAEKGKYGCP